MDQPIPPVIPQHIPRQSSKARKVFLTFFASLLLIILIACLFSSVITSVFKKIKEAVEIRFKSNTDRFSVTVLELKSEPNYFEEKVRIQCEGDMIAGIWGTDLKKEGVFETNDSNGQVYYKDGNPHVTGLSATVRADGKYSTCEILYRVTQTATGISWYNEDHYKENGSEDSGSAMTTLEIPLTLTGIQTNWPDSYERDSEIPLANLGDYKILISVK